MSYAVVVVTTPNQEADPVPDRGSELDSISELTNAIGAGYGDGCGFGMVDLRSGRFGGRGSDRRAGYCGGGRDFHSDRARVVGFGEWRGVYRDGAGVGGSADARQIRHPAPGPAALLFQFGEISSKRGKYVRYRAASRVSNR